MHKNLSLIQTDSSFLLLSMRISDSGSDKSIKKSLKSSHYGWIKGVDVFRNGTKTLPILNSVTSSEV